MELLLLIGINILLAAVMYIILSIKLTKNLYNYGRNHFEKEIRSLILDFYKESESYIFKLENKILQYKNLVDLHRQIEERMKDKEFDKNLKNIGSSKPKKSLKLKTGSKSKEKKTKKPKKKIVRKSIKTEDL